MKAINMVALLSAALLVLSLVPQSKAAPETMTNAQLAGLLSDMAGLRMPEGSENLSEAETFEIQSNMLAERGITMFVDTEPDGVVTHGLVANLVYDAVVGPNNAAIEGKIAYLALAGYLPSGGADDTMAYSEIVAALNIPELTEAVAEAYSAPFGGRARTGVLSAPANPAPETPLPLEGAASAV
jgi:hypothetical protein